MSKIFKVEHYDDTTSEHSTLEEALVETTKRLEPWREGRDFVWPRQAKDAHFANVEEEGAYVFVCTSICEATDAESYITAIEG